MNTVLLHARSSDAAHSAASKARRWKRRKAEETKKGAKRERTTFYAAQYDLDEPLLKQFLMFMAAECAEKKSTDFVEVSHVLCRRSSHHVLTADRTFTHSDRQSTEQISVICDERRRIGSARCVRLIFE